TDEPRDEAREGAAAFMRLARGDDWPRLCFQVAAHAARSAECREELATRQRAMRDRIVEVYRRWSKDFPAQPPLPIEDIAAMTFFMADGFLVDKLLDPGLRNELYPTMLAVFFRGLEAMAVGWEASEEDIRQALD